MVAGRWRSVLNSEFEPANERLRSGEIWLRGSHGVGFLWTHVGDPFQKVWVRVYDPARKCDEFVFSKLEYDAAVKKLCEMIGSSYIPPMDFATIHRATVDEERARLNAKAAPTN